MSHPYKALPDHCFWKRSIAEIPPAKVDPVVSARFNIRRTDRVATAGGCFAHHIARRLSASGFNYFVTETVHPMFGPWAADFQYGLFTARYGNIYTSRQLVQLLKRAYGLFVPDEDAWPIGNGRLVDPFRPQIQPDGFSSLEELHADRAHHFAAVRKAVEQLDVFVFTLGLTEGWVSRGDGAAFPLCPGVAGGTFSEEHYAFLNLRVADVIADLATAISFLHSKNASARVILTFSPVPLVATMEDRSVLVSTTYSKSVLRVAAEEIAAQRDFVAYFPSYEVITGNYNRGGYFAEDLRSVTEAGVSHVMRLFMKHYADNTEQQITTPTDAEQERQSVEAHIHAMQQVAAVICDEEALGRC